MADGSISNLRLGLMVVDLVEGKLKPRLAKGLWGEGQVCYIESLTQFGETWLDFGNRGCDF